MTEIRIVSPKTIRGKLKRQRQRLGGVTLVYPNERLSSIVGRAPRSREELVEHLFGYAEEYGLVDPAGRFVHANPALITLFWGRPKIRRSDLMRVVTYHLLAGLPGDPTTPVPDPIPEGEEEGILVR